MTEVPVLLLDGTGVRPGGPKARRNGVELHLAVGMVARRRQAGRVIVEARLLGATLGEGWKAMGELLAGVRPGLVVVDGEEAIADLAVEHPSGSQPPRSGDAPRSGSLRRGGAPDSPRRSTSRGLPVPVVELLLGGLRG